MVVHFVLIHEQHYRHITQPNPSRTTCHTTTNLVSACYSRPLQLCPLRNIYISKIINVCQTISHQTICPVHQVLSPGGISYQAIHSAPPHSLPSGINQALKAPAAVSPDNLSSTPCTLFQSLAPVGISYQVFPN